MRDYQKLRQERRASMLAFLDYLDDLTWFGHSFFAKFEDKPPQVNIPENQNSHEDSGRRFNEYFARRMLEE